METQLPPDRVVPAKAVRISQPERKQSAPEGEREADGTTIRVLCVDDHAVLIEGLRAQFAIEGRFQIVGRLASTDKLMDEVDRLKPDIVLLDIELPGPDVFETADRLHHAHPNLRFAFLSAHVRDGYLAAAYRCGASGYFAKGDDLDDIISGLRQIVRSTAGTFVMGTKLREHCDMVRTTSRAGDSPRTRNGQEANGIPSTPFDALTPREIEVLRLIGRGMSRVQIAGELSRSAKTVDGHQERIMKKLGLDNRAELMRFAIREGLAEA